MIYNKICLQSQDILGTTMSKLILNWCPRDVSTNNSSDMFGDKYVCISDRISKTITTAPVTVTEIKVIHNSLTVIY